MNISNVSSGDYECGSDEACDVFQVRSSVVAEGADCEADYQQFETFVTVIGQCSAEMDYDSDSDSYSWRSTIADCDAATQSIEYRVYEGVMGVYIWT